MDVTMAALQDDVQYVHNIETSPGDHCLEVAFPGGTTSPFWKADGWKYGAPVRPEWKAGACDKTKWTSVDTKEANYDGWTAAKNAPYAAVTFTKYGFDTVTPMVFSTIQVTPASATCLHNIDNEDHKCNEA